MSTKAFQLALAQATQIQREAIEWDSGALLLVAGPGSGKTQVLTCRIARLLTTTVEDNSRILALTFTNKAADEMRVRVQDFVPEHYERASIGTFHSFCTQVLRQHGVHLGIKPDFAVYGLEADRRAVLETALLRARKEGKNISPEDTRYLAAIDRFKTLLIEPEAAAESGVLASDEAPAAEVYRLYEEELRRANALDFSSMILEVFRLATKFPGIAARYRRSHPFWLIDEFQDTNDAQFRLINALAGGEFRNVFAVADDDQIIYQWNGASFRQLRRFTETFAASSLQLPTNFRCPPTIVEAANRLVAYNAQRTAQKQPLLAGKVALKLPAEKHLRVLHFKDDSQECVGVSEDIAALGRGNWGSVAVLARNRSMLDPLQQTLEARKVRSFISQRRDDFLSPEFRWMVASLYQVIRPLDRRNFAIVVESFNRICETELAPEEIIATSELSGRSYFDEWLITLRRRAIPEIGKELLSRVREIKDRYYDFIDQVIRCFSATNVSLSVAEDLAEDVRAWETISGEIARQIGARAQLEEFLQELALRSKEPGPRRDTVSLMTIHGAKGREFDFVYVIGLAEDIMPSFQSRKRGDRSAEMEEERRNCFVAITRAKESLTLSWASSYRGFPKQPSRFLREMELAD